MKPAGAEVVNCTKFLITRRPLVGGVKNCQSSQDIDKKSLLLVSLIVDLISIGHKLPIFFYHQYKRELETGVSLWLVIYIEDIFAFSDKKNSLYNREPAVPGTPICMTDIKSHDLTIWRCHGGGIGGGSSSSESNSTFSSFTHFPLPSGIQPALRRCR